MNSKNEATAKEKMPTARRYQMWLAFSSTPPTMRRTDNISSTERAIVQMILSQDFGSSLANLGKQYRCRAKDDAEDQGRNGSSIHTFTGIRACCPCPKENTGPVKNVSSSPVT